MKIKYFTVLILFLVIMPALAVQLGGAGNSTGEKVVGPLEARTGVIIGNGNLTGVNRLQINTGASDPSPSVMLKSSILEFDSEFGEASDINLRLATGETKSYPALYFTRTRGTLASPTVLQIDDKIGEVIFIGYFGSEFQKAATIRATVDDTPGTWDMPGRLSFYTCPLSAEGSAPLERMTIKNSGRIGIGTTEPTAQLDVRSSTGYNQIRMQTSFTPPSSSEARGNVGDISWDDNYVYIKTSGGWKRASLSYW